MKKLLVFAACALATSTVLAGGVQTYQPIPPSVPEPGTFGLLAMATTALLITARFKRRK